MKNVYVPTSLSGFNGGVLVMLGIFSSEGAVSQVALIVVGLTLLAVSIWAEHKNRAKAPTTTPTPE